MASEKLIKALNDQLNFEYESANYYIAMAAYCADQDLEGIENFFMVQAEEERFHARKFYDYINDVDGRVTIQTMEAPKNDYTSIKDAFETALAHEKKVTSRINDLMKLAHEEHDYATVSFLNWFVDEQVEEEASMKTIIAKIEKIANSPQGLYMLDNELASRTFTPAE
ncbi:ferritin [Clostridium sp. D2Q-11]|uniref:Ferritin n=1 Tax=Anaeromonas frigoriresistens TaxID=2683708 RepID=A0A942UTA0_9FIRM|nr:ferritin [Anaeromonas frigoriresistens]MBS4538168.1 ferritin [Anaeromonas frigoriresistens]